MPVISVKKHLTGDLSLPKGTPIAHRIAYNRFLRKLAAAARDCKQVWDVLDGYRPYADQLRLWNLYQSGKGNLAAYPGTSDHGRGRAGDVYVANKPIGESDRRVKACEKHGLHFPVPSEKWHVVMR